MLCVSTDIPDYDVLRPSLIPRNHMYSRLSQCPGLLLRKYGVYISILEDVGLTELGARRTVSPSVLTSSVHHLRQLGVRPANTMRDCVLVKNRTKQCQLSCARQLSRGFTPSGGTSSAQRTMESPDALVVPLEPSYLKLRTARLMESICGLSRTVDCSMLQLT